jgi:hypothetical protein
MVHYATGTATTEQDIIDAIDTFLTSTIGDWTLQGTITDDANDNDRVYFSRGSNPGRYQDLYVRWRGYSNYIYVYGYSRWNGPADYSDEVHNSSNTRMAVGGTNMEYHLFGTSDYLWVVVKNSSDGYYYSSFGGYIVSYYEDADDTLPLAIIGQNGSSTDYSSSRCYMYYPVVSGSSGIYKSHVDSHNNLLVYGDPNARDGSQATVPFVMYCDTSGYKEVRGELPGTLRFSGVSLAAADWVTLSGTASKFFIQKYDNDSCYGYGPVAV